MVDAEGKVIGVLIFGLRDSEGLNFVVPANYARGLLNFTESYTLVELRQELAAAQDMFRAQDRREQLPTHWRSLETGRRYILTFEGEYLYVEMVVPQDERQSVHSSMGELRKEGQGYEGLYRHAGRCWWRDWRGNVKWNNCTISQPLAITSISPTRIEGWGMDLPPGSKFDCKKCTYNKEFFKAHFVWIPE